jgi:hypothetical protein
MSKLIMNKEGKMRTWKIYLYSRQVGTIRSSLTTEAGVYRFLVKNKGYNPNIRVTTGAFVQHQGGDRENVEKIIHGHTFYRYNYNGYARMDKKTAIEGIEYFEKRLMYDSFYRQAAEIVMIKEGQGWSLWHRPIRKQRPKDPKMLALYLKHNKKV